MTQASRTQVTCCFKTVEEHNTWDRADEQQPMRAFLSSPCSLGEVVARCLPVGHGDLTMFPFSFSRLIKNLKKSMAHIFLGYYLLVSKGCNHSIVCGGIYPFEHYFSSGKRHCLLMTWPPGQRRLHPLRPAHRDCQPLVPGMCCCTTSLVPGPFTATTA